MKEPGESGASGGASLNLSGAARHFPHRIGAGDEGVFLPALEMLRASVFHCDNAGALRMDWPRVPLPGTAEGSRVSSHLG